MLSCQQGELLNSEADILEIVLPVNMQVGKALISNNKVVIPKLAFSLDENEILDEQLKSLTPKFVLTQGATISDSDVARDFTIPQTYTVTSEDGKWKKNYEITFFTSQFEQKEFNFSHYRTFVSSSNKKYHEFFELNDNGTDVLDVWSSGNGGFAITANVNAAPEDYPTFAIENGKSGSAARLVTCSTGGLGALVGMPIAAGNLFLGDFDVSKAMANALLATKLGIPTTQSKPGAIGFWAKYKPGDEYKDKTGAVLQMTDHPEIYATLYEAEIDIDGNPIKLNGTNGQTADNIISIAIFNAENTSRITVDDIETGEYSYIEIPFEERLPFDQEKQLSGKYYITIVFSSSAKGSLFEGAVGSTLCVDEIKLIE